MALEREEQTILLCGEPHDRSAMVKVLSATGARVVHQERWRPEHLQPEPQLIILDHNSLHDDIGEIMEQVAYMQHVPPVILFTSERNKEALIDLLAHDVLTNIMANNFHTDATELIVTVQKLLRKNFYGPEKYLTWGAHLFSQTLSHSAEKKTAMDGMVDYLIGIGCNMRLVQVAQVVADEFIMNAMYNAPVDAHGHRRYAHQRRDSTLHLDPRENVTFRYACDGRRVALSVKDNFGLIGSPTVRGYLRRCMRGGEDQMIDDNGGAGLGLYGVFSSLNWMVVNVTPGICTEMIGIIDISRTFRNFVEQPKSLHFFVGESHE